MALAHFLFRCPLCGHDPMSGRGDQAWCGGCSARFGRGRVGCRVEVNQAKGPPEARPAAELADAIDARGGPMTAATRADGTIRYEARARARWRVGEEAVRYRGRLVGFQERMGTATPGVLRATADGLEFDPESGASTDAWPWLELRAVQTSSSRLQIRTGADELVQFRLEKDSPRRWEVLVRRLVSRAYDRQGRGEVVEFQPRIVLR
jgi:hypothetical protein